MESVTITIIEKINEGRYILKCSRCKGTGKANYNSNIACTTCNGKGLVAVEIDGSTPFVRCARCNGTGKANYNSNIACSSCKGTGAQPITGNMEIIK